MPRPCRSRLPSILLVSFLLVSCWSGALFAADDEATDDPQQPIAETQVVDADELIEEGKSFFRKSDFSKARETFNRVLAVQPDHPQAYYWLGQLDLKEGKTEEGLSKIRRSTDLAPDNSQLWQALGRVYEENKYFAEAEQAYLKAIELDENNLLVRLALGLFYNQQSRHDEAIDLLEEIIIKHTRTREALLAQQQLKEIYPVWADSQVKLLQSGDEIDPDRVAKILQRSQRLLNQKFPDIARTVLEPFVKRFPENPQGYYWLGQVYLALDKHDEGISHVQTSVRLAPDNLALKEQLARAYLIAGDENKADEVLAEILAIDAQYKQQNSLKRAIGMLRASHYTDDGEYDQALQVYQELQVMLPRDAQILMRIAEVQDARGENELADQVIREMLSYAPDSIPARKQLIEFYEKRGDSEKVREHAAKILELAAGGPDRRFALDRLGLEKGLDELKQKRYERALEALEQVREYAPDEILVLLNIGVAHYQNKENEKAIEVFNRVIEIEPGMAEPYLQLGQVYAGQGEFEKSVENYSKALELGRNSPTGRQAGKVLIGMEKEIITLGKEKLAAGDLPKAEELFSSLIARNPDSAQGHYWLGKVLLKRKKIEEGLSGIEYSASLAPNNWKMQEQLAESYRDAELYAKALKSYQRAYELAPDQHDLLVDIAAMYQQLDDQENFRATLKKYLSLESDTDKQIGALDLVGYSDALDKLERNDIAAARLDAEEILKIVPDSPLALGLSGSVYRHEGQLQLAKQMYQKALSIDAGNSRLQYQQALVLKDLGETDEAIRLADAVVKSSDKSVAVEARALVQQLNRDKGDELLLVIKQRQPLSQEQVTMIAREGERLWHRHAFREAQRVLLAASKKIKNNAVIFYWLGQSYFEQGDKKNGLKYVARSVELMPQNDKLKVELAKLYSRAGRNKDALAVYDELIAGGTADAVPYYLAARIYWQQGDQDTARQYVAEAVRLNADNRFRETALNVVGLDEAVEKAIAKEYQEAEVMLDELLGIAPDFPKLVRYAAIVKVALEKKDEAEPLLQRLVKVSPGDYTGYKLLADIYMEEGRDDEALLLYEQAEAQAASGRAKKHINRSLVELYKTEGEHYLELVSEKKVLSEDEIDDGVGKARGLIKVKEYALAVKILDVVLDNEPNNPQATYWQGIAYTEQKDFDKGIPLLEHSVKLAPENRRLVWELGKVYEDAGRWEDALQAYLQVKNDIKEASRRAVMMQAQIYRQNKQYDLAVQQYRQLLQDKPEDRDLEYRIAELYEEQGAAGKADSIYTDLLARYPDDIELHKKLSNVYFGRGQTEVGIDHVRKILELATDPKDKQFALDKLGFKRAAELAANGRYRDALQLFGKMSEYAPDNEVVLLDMGQIYIKLKDTAHAEFTFRRLLAVAPENAEAHMFLGDLLMARGEEDEAITHYEAASEFGGDSKTGRQADLELARLSYQKALALYKQEKIDEAIAEYEQVLEHAPNNVRSMSALATLYAVKGSMSQAEEYFNKVLDQDPRNAHAYRMLARVYEREQKLPEALEAKAHLIALEHDPEVARKLADELSITLAKKLFNEGELLMAFRELDRVKVESPDSVQANLYLGILYSRVGDLQNAIKAYEEVLRQNPDNHQVRFSLAVMYERTNEDELALAQYQKIIQEAKEGLTLERARERIEEVKRRTRLLSSTLDYRISSGQNKGETSAATSTFSSTLNVGLNLAYKPAKPLTLTGIFGANYTGNHKSGTDSLAPRIGLNAALNYEDAALTGGVTMTEVRTLLLEDNNGETISGFLRGLVRFDNPFDLIKQKEEEEPRHEEGVTDITRRRPGEEEADNRKRPPLQFEPNPELQKLLEAMQEDIKEEIKNHVVVKGDTLWDISADLLDDPWLWPEIWQVNPKIENPHLIYPGDVISLVYINGRPRLLLKRAELEPEFLSVEEGMRLYHEAVVLIQQGHYQEAVDRLQRILEFISNDVKTNLSMAIALHRLGRFDEAETYYRSVLELDPRHHEARFLLAEMYSDAGRYKDAIAELEYIIANSQDELQVRDARKQLLEVYRDDARQMIDKLATMDGAEDELLLDIIMAGIRLYEFNALDYAEEVFDLLVQQRPEYAEGHYWLAKIIIERGDIEGAIEHMQISAAMAPENIVYHEDLAVLYEQLDDLDRAIEQYSLIAESSDNTMQVEWAEKRLSLIRASQLVARQNFQEAISVYEGLLILYPSDTNIIQLTAQLYLRLGNMEAAESLFRRALDIDNQNIEAAMGLVRLYAQQGDTQQLADTIAMMKGMELTEDQKEELRNIIGFEDVIALVRQGEYKSALAQLEAMNELLGGDTIVMINIAVTYQALGEYDKAVRILKDVVENDPDNLTARLRLGQLYAEMDLLEEAIAEFRAVVAMSSGTDIEETAMEWLDEIQKRREKKFQELEAGEPVPKSLALTFTYSDFEPSSVSYADTYSYSAGLAFTYPGGNFGNWVLGYTHGITENEHKWGTDYAYTSDEFSLSFSRPILSSKIRGLFGSLSVSTTKVSYTNVDTNALYGLGLAQKRENTRQDFSASLFYRLHEQLRFSFSYSKSTNESNLPLGTLYVILPAAPAPIPAVGQGTSLGGYEIESLGLSMSLTF